MKPCKLLLAAAGATLLLAIATAAAAARQMSSSSSTLRESYTRVDFTGGFGTIECELTLESTLHSRILNKVANSLIGYITSVSVRSCRRGGATALRETLPWHSLERAFAGTLPNISAISSTIRGTAFRLREPTFGITCLTNPATSNWIVTRTVQTSVLQGGTVSGTISCEGLAGSLGGRISIDNGAGGQVSVTLI